MSPMINGIKHRFILPFYCLFYIARNSTRDTIYYSVSVWLDSGTQLDQTEKVLAHRDVRWTVEGSWAHPLAPYICTLVVAPDYLLLFILWIWSCSKTTTWFGPGKLRLGTSVRCWVPDDDTDRVQIKKNTPVHSWIWIWSRRADMGSWVKEEGRTYSVSTKFFISGTACTAESLLRFLQVWCDTLFLHQSACVSLLVSL